MDAPVGGPAGPAVPPTGGLRRRRRRLLLAGAALIVVLVVAVPLTLRAQATKTQTPIKVGLLHSLTGTVAIAEKDIVQAEQLAIEEINAKGGVLGRQLEPVVVDGASDWPTFDRGAERLLTEDKVDVIFGCYTSASRRTIVPTIERLGGLLVYPTYYEGLEASPNVIYTGSAPNQFVIPAVNWAFANRGPRFFLVGSDYVFPQSVNAIVKGVLDFLGGEVVGEEYLPLGDQQVGPIVDRIVETKPDVILSTVVGDSNIPFFRELRAAGVTPQTMPALSLVISEAELTGLNPADMEGNFTALSYFQSVDTKANREFVARFRKRWGADSVISDQMEAAYTGVHLWALAAEKAGSSRPDDVLEAAGGITWEAPDALVHLDAENHHLWKPARIARIKADGQVEIIWSSETVVHPVPYPPYRTKEEWQHLLDNMLMTWKGSWSAPPREAPPE